MAGRVRFVKQYTSVSGRVFRQYERTDTGQRVDIVMRNDRGYNTLYNYTQAEATAEAKRRLGVTDTPKAKAKPAAKRKPAHKHRWRTINGNRVCMDCKTRVKGGD